MATVAERLVTAEEFRRLPDDGVRRELVRGRVVAVNVPAPRHGQICGRVVRILGRFLDRQDTGHLVSNDSGVVTGRDPDTVRGTDVAFFSYQRVPRGPLPEGYLGVAPELVFEVRSPTDRWAGVVVKVGEYLAAGVTAVCVLDSGTQAAHVYGADAPTRVVAADEDLTFPEVLPGFRAPVRAFFE